MKKFSEIMTEAEKQDKNFVLIKKTTDAGEIFWEYKHDFYTKNQLSKLKLGWERDLYDREHRKVKKVEVVSFSKFDKWKKEADKIAKSGGFGSQISQKDLPHSEVYFNPY